MMPPVQSGPLRPAIDCRPRRSLSRICAAPAASAAAARRPSISSQQATGQPSRYRFVAGVTFVDRVDRVAGVASVACGGFLPFVTLVVVPCGAFIAGLLRESQRLSRADREYPGAWRPGAVRRRPPPLAVALRRGKFPRPGTVLVAAAAAVCGGRHPASCFPGKRFGSGRVSDFMDFISVRGAREHNLKNITLEIPRNRLVGITRVSGSGKSSLAFDTLFAEGQRRYVESLSSYARQFLQQMEKPDVDSIEGLSPAISIEQKSVSKNPRSTVGTVTEIHDYLRLLYASIGLPHCPSCGQRIRPQTVPQMVVRAMELPPGSRLVLYARSG